MKQFTETFKSENILTCNSFFLTKGVSSARQSSIFFIWNVISCSQQRLSLAIRSLVTSGNIVQKFHAGSQLQNGTRQKVQEPPICAMSTPLSAVKCSYRFQNWWDRRSKKANQFCYRNITRMLLLFTKQRKQLNSTQLNSFICIRPRKSI